MPLAKLLRFQGALKILPPARYAALQQSLLEEGFAAPVYVWWGHDYILDGHQRLYVIEREGWEIEGGVPVVSVEAPTEQEAARKILRVYTPVYGQVDPQGLFDFLQRFEIDLGDFEFSALPDFDQKAFYDEYFATPEQRGYQATDSSGDDEEGNWIVVSLQGPAEKVTTEFMDQLHKFAQRHGLRVLQDEESRPNRRYWGSWKKGDVVKPGSGAITAGEEATA